MKRLKHRLLITAASILSVIVLYSCSKSFLDRPPVGEINESDLNNKDGINGLLIGAYAFLDGNGGSFGVDDGQNSVWNSWLGSVGADDARKGGGYQSQTDRLEIEGYTYTPFNDILAHRWRGAYAGVQRANETIRMLNRNPGIFTDAEALQITAEARFLRGIYHLEAAKTWRNIPFVDETITFEANNYKVKNDVPVWPRIEDDFKFAAENLTPTKSEIGRANSWAAKCFLIKTYMFQAKFNDAKPILDDVIANGVTSSGKNYDLVPDFRELFRTNNEDHPEAVFAVQMSVKDGANGDNGNHGEALNQPPFFKQVWNTDSWGNQPSLDLGNAYKTENGLPMLDTYKNAPIFMSDFGILGNAPFTQFGGPVDPRLDWTIARRDIPFHDYGLLQKWSVDDVGGPFRTKKSSPWKADEANGVEIQGGWFFTSGINFHLIRFADVLLWGAEVEVEIGSLDKAQEYVNRVRARAANQTAWVKTYVDNANPAAGFTNTPAANYDIEEYPAGYFSATLLQAGARKAVRFERRLELATEGHRFFDLSRYELVTPGNMKTTITNYMNFENQVDVIARGEPNFIYKDAVFVQGKNEIYAIPQSEIDATKVDGVPTLTQNPLH